MNKNIITIIATAALATFASADTTVKLSNVHLCCNGCVTGAEKAVAKAKGVTAAVDKDAGTVTLTAADKAAVQSGVDALVAAGYFGKSDSADISVKDTSGAKTVAFWVRVSGNAGSSDAPWVTLPVHRGGDAWAEFSGNHLPGEGVLGALRMNTGAASVVGTTALRDGRWHHLSAVFGQSAKNPGKLHSKIYVDGMLEPLSSKVLGRRATAKIPADLDGMLRLGGRPGSSEKLHAAIDELLVADRALAPQEIRYLMRTNALMTPEALAAN